MTHLEITDAKTQLLDRNAELEKNKTAEKRKFSAEELTEYRENLEKIEEFRLMEQNLQYKEPVGKIIMPTVLKAKPKSESQFSLIRSINDILENRQQTDIARDIFTFGKNEFRKAGVSSAGSIVIPTEMRANILAGTQYAGQEIVQEDKKAILPPLTDYMVLAKAGATFMTGLIGNVSMPSYAGTVVAWKAEVGAADDGGGAFSEVELSPKRLTAYILVSKLFLAQDGVGAERLLLENIASSVARKLEATILGHAAGSATQPQGMGYLIHQGRAGARASAAPTYDDIIGMESAVDVSNALAGNLAYITNGTGRGVLKSTLKVAEYPAYLAENNEVNGYPLHVTNSVTSAVGTTDNTGNLLVFGNWADLVVTQWGGYDITVDPYTAAATNQVKITINAYFDAKGLRGATTDDDYRYSFNRINIE